jgi:hypothetical protein
MYSSKAGAYLNTLDLDFLARDVTCQNKLSRKFLPTYTGGKNPLKHPRFYAHEAFSYYRFLNGYMRRDDFTVSQIESELSPPGLRGIYFEQCTDLRKKGAPR